MEGRCGTLAHTAQGKGGPPEWLFSPPVDCCHPTTTHPQPPPTSGRCLQFFLYRARNCCTKRTLRTCSSNQPAMAGVAQRASSAPPTTTANQVCGGGTSLLLSSSSLALCWWCGAQRTACASPVAPQYIWLAGMARDRRSPLR